MSIGSVCANGLYPQSTDQKKSSSNLDFSNTVADKACGLSGNKSSYQVYLKSEDMLYSGGNGTGLSFYLKYATDSTEDNPVMIVKGIDENGKEFEERITVNNINPHKASIIEMRALEAYTGADKRGGLTSLPMSAGEMGLYDKRDFMNMFADTIQQQRLLGEKAVAMAYQKNMQTYWDFMDLRTNYTHKKDTLW